MRASLSFNTQPSLAFAPSGPVDNTADAGKTDDGSGGSGGGGSHRASTAGVVMSSSEQQRLRPSSAMVMLAERQMPRGPLSFGHAFSGVGFFSIAETKFARSARLNAIRIRARHCFIAVFFLVSAMRMISREGILQLRVCDTRFVDDTHALHLPLGSRCDSLPEETLEQFRRLALNRLRLVFQPLVLRRLLRKSLQSTFNQHYRDSVPVPTTEDLRLASSFFSLFPTPMLEQLIAKGRRRVYHRGMWVGTPRSARSAARSAVNRSSRSRLSQMLPALSSSGVMPEVAPALYSAFIVLSGVVTDLDNNDCSIGECYGETCAIAEGGVTGDGFKVYSNHALTWEVDVFDIVEMISRLPQKQYDAVLAFIVDRRVQIITQYFRPSISEVQQWNLFRTASAVDVTTHILPRLVPRVFFCGTTIVSPESSESDRSCYFVARGCVRARGSEAIEKEEEPEEWRSFGEYEGVFSEGFDLSFYASTIVDCWVLPRAVIQSITKIPYLRPDILSSALVLREELLRRCGPSRAVIENVLFPFLGKRLHPRIVDTVLRLLIPKVYPAGERAITAGEDERTALFFVRGKLNQSSAHGFIPHTPPAIYCPSALHQMFDPLQCHSVGAVTSSWKLSLVAVRNVECWAVSVSKMHAALKIFFDTCDLNPNTLTGLYVAPPKNDHYFHHRGATGSPTSAGGHHHHHYSSGTASFAHSPRRRGSTATTVAMDSASSTAGSFAFPPSSSAGPSPQRGGGGGGGHHHSRQNHYGAVSSHQMLQQQQSQAQFPSVLSESFAFGEQQSSFSAFDLPKNLSMSMTGASARVSAANSPSGGGAGGGYRSGSAGARRMTRGSSMRKDGPPSTSAVTMLTPAPPPAASSSTPQRRQQKQQHHHHQKNSNSKRVKSPTKRPPAKGSNPTTPVPVSAHRHFDHRSSYDRTTLASSTSEKDNNNNAATDYPFDEFTLRTNDRGTERVQAMRQEMERQFERNMKGPEINRWLQLPTEHTARRMSDLEGLKVHVEPPDKRFLLLMRKLPQTPRVHGKPAQLFNAPLAACMSRKKVRDDDDDDDVEVSADNNLLSQSSRIGTDSPENSRQHHGIVGRRQQPRRAGSGTGAGVSFVSSGAGGGAATGGRHHHLSRQSQSVSVAGSAVAAQVLTQLLKAHDDKVGSIRKLEKHQMSQIHKLAAEKRVPKPDSL